MVDADVAFETEVSNGRMLFRGCRAMALWMLGSGV